MKTKKYLSILALLLFSSIALAHPGHTEHDFSGFISGLLHPLTGLDHLLAMFAVGLWAAQQQGKARLVVPATFILAMLFAGLSAAYLGITLPFVENAIAVSVLALGLLVALAIRLPLFVAILGTALFAVNHGYAHGVEIPVLASPAGFAMGFVLATMALHAIGFGLVSFLPPRFAPLVRMLGTCSAGAGLWLLAS
ncbi:HupE/UreJ protein [Nitrosococcus oceani ATCC 19707]|uniref:HupE/UreJ protein n=2 Tax=Nitrosococcus oceani TaxID=1229 RepID=Q3J774_NITOC|nr:HupE/UreJ family protein [Nitrosococcus oceani]ABA59322.1 HupE/UreJ protein [Nitrosococcus oceani ATCC 19707]EDZ65926.1 HupE / UreJ protein [Nitrosococcus oceani AFC27]KFI18209.1 protein hupE [Nitrosococcus oceani C-27]GEM20108.1 protein hupE [Nitrosococcus oceani]